MWRSHGHLVPLEEVECLHPNAVSGFKVEGLGLRVSGLGCRLKVSGSGKFTITPVLTTVRGPLHDCFLHLLSLNLGQVLPTLHRKNYTTMGGSDYKTPSPPPQTSPDRNNRGASNRVRENLFGGGIPEEPINPKHYALSPVA